MVKGSEPFENIKTWADLLDEIKIMSSKQLDMPVMVYDLRADEYHEARQIFIPPGRGNPHITF